MGQQKRTKEKSDQEMNLVKLLRTRVIDRNIVFENTKCDIYSGQKELDQIKHPQVDHIIEIQIFAHAVANACPDGVSNKMLIDLRMCINQLNNFNVTSRMINLKKRDAICEQLKLIKKGSKNIYSLRAGLLTRLNEFQMTGICSAMISACKVVSESLDMKGLNNVSIELKKLINLFDISESRTEMMTTRSMIVAKSKKEEPQVQVGCVDKHKRCVDGTLDMRFACNKGKDKWKD